MLRYSFSTVMMTVLASSLLIWMIVLCLRHRGILYSVGARLSILFLSVTMLRLFLPFELPFSRNVNLHGIIGKVLAGVQHPYFYLGGMGISVWSALQCIWLCGTAVSLYRLYAACRIIRRHVRRYGQDISSKEPYHSVFLSTCRRQERSMPILLVPGLDTPRQDRILHPRILLPAEMTFSEEQLRYVFQHELTHARHRDVLTKLLLNLLAAVYWWNPLIRPLRKQADVLLEMRVDGSMLAGKNETAKSRYASVLLEIAAQAAELLGKQSMSNNATSSNPLTSDKTTDLEERLHMMYNGRKVSVPLALLLLTLSLSFSALSYAFIFEPFAMSPVTEIHEGAVEADYQEMYAVEREDGGYDIYLNGEPFDQTDTLTLHPLIPVIER